MTFKRIYDVDDHYFDDINTEEKAYWLGFLAADGSIGERNKLVLRLAAIDFSHIEKFKDAIQSEHNIITVTNKKGFSNSCIIIRSTILAKSLAKYYITSQKTLSVHRPDLDLNLLRHYWRGVFDGDGSIYQLKRNGQTHISLCGNYFMIADYIYDIKQYLNIDAKIENKQKIQSAYTRKRSDVLSILDWLYNDSKIHLDRKYAKYQTFKHNYIPVDPKIKEILSPEQFVSDYRTLGTLAAIAAKYNVHRCTIERLNKKYKNII